MMRRPDLWMWPTPTAGDAKSSGSRNLPGSKAHTGVSLTDAVKFGNSRTPWRHPTPTASDATGGPAYSKPAGRDGGPPLKETIRGGPLNPGWVEWLMGWPTGWTSLEPLPVERWEEWVYGACEGLWWRSDPSEDPRGVPRTAKGVKHRPARLKALGNGQVPAVVVVAWNVLTTAMTRSRVAP
jgi:hypothetical protein